MALFHLDEAVVQPKQQEPVRVFAAQLAVERLVQRRALIEKNAAFILLLFESGGKASWSWFWASVCLLIKPGASGPGARRGKARRQYWNPGAGGRE